MVIAGLIVGSLVLAAFLILVAGIHRTDRSRGLCDPSGDSRAETFARRVIGVYVRQPTGRDHSHDQADHHEQARR
jgi:hypothetical protein